MERITSRQNPIVARFRALARGVERTAGSRAVDVLLDGAHLLEEALAARAEIEIAAFSDREPTDGLARAVTSAGGRTIVVADQVLAAMSPVRQHTGVVAIAKARAANVDELFAPSPALVVALAGVQDPGNVGTIVRTAAAFGATGVAATDDSADPFGWKALRGAMGGTFRVPVVPHAALDDVVAQARESGCRVIAAVPRGGAPLTDADLRRPSAILLGAEGTGLDERLAASADERVTIPMAGTVESLNVAATAAILLYEAARQRGWLR